MSGEQMPQGGPDSIDVDAATEVEGEHVVPFRLSPHDQRRIQRARRVLEALKQVKPVRGESEYVMRSPTMPDRRLSAEDQDLQRELMIDAVDYYGWDQPVI